MLPLRSSILPSTELILPYLREIEANRYYSNRGPLLKRFEARLADHFGVSPEHVAVVSNGTTGLQMALRAQTGPIAGGRLCACPAFTFAASPVAASLAGFSPAFLDVDTNSWALNAEYVLEANSHGQGDIAAAMPVSVFGAPIDPMPWEKMAKDQSIAVVIDAAWGFDSIIPGKVPTVISLHATKVFGIGEGGVVVCQDAPLIDRIRSLSNFGFDADRKAALVGATNGKLSEYSAAVGLAAFDQWPRVKEKAISLAKTYEAVIRSNSKAGGAQPRLPQGFDGSWAPGAIVVETAPGKGSAVVSHLASVGYEARRWWHPVCPDFPAFSGAQIYGDLPISTHLSETVVNLPFHEEVSESDVQNIVGELSAAMGDSELFQSIHSA